MHTLDNVFFYNMLCFGFVLNVFLCFVHLSQKAVLHFPLKMDLSKSEKKKFFLFKFLRIHSGGSVFGCVHDSSSSFYSKNASATFKHKYN